ncbi:MAG TPA: NAD(P)/FAD-dependent oxidoreductase [Candidatus Xenobia bacterium]|jgi:phytoene dehydrogenase-like protein
MKYDAIVIGGGPNGLVAAATLGRLGERVLLLEGRDTLGGRLAPLASWPGFKLPGVLHSVGRLRPKVARELGIDGGVVPHDPVVFSPHPDGRWLAVWRDERQTARDLARLSPRDARRYPEYQAFVRRLSSFASALLDMSPPPLGTPDLSQFLDVAQLGIRFRLLGKADMIRAMRLATTCVADFLGEWFSTDLLKASLAAPALWGLTCGPWAAGTGATLLYNALEGPFGMPKGDLVGRLVGAAQRWGGEIRRQSPVDEILLDGSRVTGVRLANGEVVEATRVFSALDPKRTFLELIRPWHVAPGFSRQIRHYHSRGVTARLLLAVEGLPEFHALRGVPKAEAARLLGGRIHLGPSLDDLERASDEAKYGRYSRQPMMEMLIPSLTDASVAPAGQHLLSLMVQWAPYELREGYWDDRREAFADDVVRALETYMPGLSNRIKARHVTTPLDMERSLGLTQGHIHHGEHSLHQLLVARPVPAVAQYASPIDNLYLCGAGVHPGGGISGAPASNAIHAALDSTARPAVGPVGTGLAVLGAGLAVGVAVRALNRKNGKDSSHGNSDTLS